MTSRHAAVIIAASALLLGGCATSEEWSAWKGHRTHFASGEHLVFSVRNAEGQTPRVARHDIVLAADEGWWGRAITVAQEQILDR